MIVFPTSRWICATLWKDFSAMGGIVWFWGRFQFHPLGQQGTRRNSRFRWQIVLLLRDIANADFTKGTIFFCMILFVLWTPSKISGTTLYSLFADINVPFTIKLFVPWYFVLFTERIWSQIWVHFLPFAGREWFVSSKRNWWGSVYHWKCFFYPFRSSSIGNGRDCHITR